MSEQLEEARLPPEDEAWKTTTSFTGSLEQVLRYSDGEANAIGNFGAVQSVLWLVAELFLKDCGKEVSEFRHGILGRQLYIDNERKLCFYPRRHAPPPAGSVSEGNTGQLINVIAQFIGDRYKDGFMLLNGDGFESWETTQWQDNLRGRSREIFGVDRTIIIPFEAINGARIDKQTIRPIHITDDVEEMIFHDVGSPPGWRDEFLADASNGSNLRLTRVWMDALWNSNPLAESSGGGMGATPPRSRGTLPTRRARSGTLEFDHNGRRWRLSYEAQNRTERYICYWYVWQGLLDGDGQWGWQRVMFNPHDARQDNQPFTSWREDRHRLGASIFWANGFDGKRHRFISAFDQHEPEPLYYLAQLPDKGEVKTYEDAIQLLAPPIVHQARAQGRHVERQGDVFAIETNVKTREIYRRAKTRVRRSVVMQGGHTVNFQPTLLPLNQGHAEWVAPKKGEVSECVLCPGCGNHRFKVGFGPKARRALMIFGTSHTAQEVVVCDGGVTFIRGMMHHDPMLEEPGRQAEHVNRPLEEGRWYLAVRNTVPRQGSTRRRREPSTDAQQQALTQDTQVVAA